MRLSNISQMQGAPNYETKTNAFLLLKPASRNTLRNILKVVWNRVLKNLFCAFIVDALLSCRVLLCVALALWSQLRLNKPLITVLIILNMPPLCIPNCCSMMTMRMNFFFVSKLFPGHFYVYRQEKITPPNWFLYFSVWNQGLYYSTPQDCNVRNIPKG